jgi:SAM-dependent methyltransferase
MGDWSQGYVTEVEYTAGLYDVQAPNHLDLVALVNGVEPPERLAAPAYCELGCGNGFTTLALAAINPEMRFWGIDFNPAHIARARAAQAEFGIDNATFLELSFDELTGAGAPELPPFDYVTLHGVYSWVAAPLRAAIVRFLAAAVKPGGLVYVSYNSLPGRNQTAPLQHLIREFARHDPDRVDRAVARGIAMAHRVDEAGSRYLDRAMLGFIDELLAADQAAYLAHENCNAHWTPRYHHEVAGEMAAAKLDYVGAAVLLENFVQLNLTPDQRKLRDAAPPALRETVSDYFLERGLRRDIYVRGARRLPEARVDALLRRVRLALTMPAGAARYAFDLPLGKVEFNRRIYEPVFAALASGPATIGALLDLPAVRDHGKASAVELAGVLIGTDQALRLTAVPDEAGRMKARRLNAMLAAQALAARRNTGMLAAPAGGTGIRLTPIELLVYWWLQSGAATDEAAIMAAVGEAGARGIVPLAEDGTPAPPSDAPERLRQQVSAALTAKVPLWRAFGLL